MIALKHSTQSLTVQLSAAPATNEPYFVSSYYCGCTDPCCTTTLGGALTGETPVEIMNPPADNATNTLQYLTIRNNDTANITIIVNYDENSTVVPFQEFTIASGFSLNYEDHRGWYVLDEGGASQQGTSLSGTAGGDLSGTYPDPEVVGLQGHALPAFSAGALVNDGSGTWSYIGYSSAYGTVSNLVARDANGNTHANNFESAYSASTSGSGRTLTAASQRTITVSGTFTGAVTLPDATTLQVGHTFEINNNCTVTTIQVKYNGGALLTNALAGSCLFVKCTDNSTAAGTWDWHWWMPSSAAFGTAGLTIIGSLTATNIAGSTSWNATKISAAYGGTGKDTSGDTGIPQILSGTWSVSTALANSTTATTQSPNDNSTKLATTAYVDKLYSEVYLVSGNQTTTSATATNITELVTPTLTASKRYYVKGILWVGCNNTGGVNIAVSIPAGATMNIAVSGGQNASTGANGGKTILQTSATLSSVLNYCIYNGQDFIWYEGEVSLGVTAGTIQIMFASNVGGQTSTIYQTGTILFYRQIN